MCIRDRYMTARSYNYQETLDSLEEYAEWREGMERKYSLEDFEFFLKENVHLGLAYPRFSYTSGRT